MACSTVALGHSTLPASCSGSENLMNNKTFSSSSRLSSFFLRGDGVFCSSLSSLQGLSLSDPSLSWCPLQASLRGRVTTCMAWGASVRLIVQGKHLERKKSKVEDDPWESFFQQLEKDLENDTDDFNEEEITEEDVANFEKELDTLLEDIENASTDNSKANKVDDIVRAQDRDHVKDDDDHVLVDEKKDKDAKQNNKDDHDKGLAEAGEGSENEEADFELADADDEDFSDDEEPRTVALEKWQLRKLAAAVELGRRKVHIKSLAAELKLDREDVIFFLKTPPPELLMAVGEIEENADGDGELDSEHEEEVDDNNEKVDDSVSLSIDNNSDMEESTKAQKPTYGPRDWYKGKRIKKTNLLTLHRVYKRSRWPSNSMIESLVQATHLPRSRILEWFEEERAKAGVRSPSKQSKASRKLWKQPVTNSFERVQ